MSKQVFSCVQHFCSKHLWHASGSKPLFAPCLFPGHALVLLHHHPCPNRPMVYRSCPKTRTRCLRPCPSPCRSLRYILGFLVPLRAPQRRGGLLQSTWRSNSSQDLHGGDLLVNCPYLLIRSSHRTRLRGFSRRRLPSSTHVRSLRTRTRLRRGARTRAGSRHDDLNGGVSSLEEVRCSRSKFRPRSGQTRRRSV